MVFFPGSKVANFAGHVGRGRMPMVYPKNNYAKSGNFAYNLCNFLMDLLLTRSLSVVAQAGTISKAASRLGISQSALSRRLQTLESHLEVELLVHRGRGIALTEAGRLVVAEGGLLLERFERMKGNIREVLRLDAGTVRIGGGASAVSYLLPPAMARFRKKHPKIKFRLEEAGSRHIEAAVLEGRIEIGVVTLPVGSRELEVEPLIRDRIVLVASAEHAFTQRRRVVPENLQGQALIGFEAGSAIRSRIDEALHEAGVAMNVVMEVRSIAAILKLVESTASLAFVSEMGVENHPVIDVRGFRVERELALISRRGFELSAATRAFCEELRLLAAAKGGESRAMVR
jgi:DNA-binding transcriptional LysR family regulator